MQLWIIWLIAAGILGVGEMHQGAFYLAPFALGAAVAAIVSLLGAGAGVSAVVFVATSVIVFATLRPVARRHRQLPRRYARVPLRSSAGRRSCSSGSPTTRAWAV